MKTYNVTYWRKKDATDSSGARVAASSGRSQVEANSAPSAISNMKINLKKFQPNLDIESLEYYAEEVK